MEKSMIVEYWRTLRQQKARALATIERANADLREIEDKMKELNDFVGIDSEEKKLERQEMEKESRRDDEEDIHPQMGER